MGPCSLDHVCEMADDYFASPWFPSWKNLPGCMLNAKIDSDPGELIEPFGPFSYAVLRPLAPLYHFNESVLCGDLCVVV